MSYEIISLEEVQTAYQTYRVFVEKLPMEQRINGCITFNAYIDGAVAADRELTHVNNYTYKIPAKMYRRIKQLLSPNGEVLFRTWVARQCAQ